jgi:uncharacterized membrane protein
VIRGRYLVATLFIAGGVMHFVKPKVYREIVPPVFPAPEAIVALSGVAEIAGGVGVLVPATRPAARVALAALLVAVLPVHVYMVADPKFLRIAPRWVWWARLALQFPLIAWVLKATKDDPPVDS